MKYDLLVVDGPYLAHRSMDAPFKLTTSKGLDATMLFVFLRSVKAYKNKTKASTVIIAWESPKTHQWRKDESKTYKQNRGHISQFFINQAKDLQEALCHLNAIQYTSPGNEADDIIANIVHNNAGKNIAIFTKDKDIMQLASDTCHIFDGKQYFSNGTVYQKYQLLPSQLIDLFSIMGDKSDNIKGVDGYGIKKATKLLIKYQTISNIPYETFTDDEWRVIQKNRRLISLNESCELVQINNRRKSLHDILEKYELKSIKEKINEYNLGDTT